MADTISEPTANNNKKEESSSWKRKLSNFLGFGTVGLTVLIMIFFLVIPVAIMVGKAFYNGDTLTLEYFNLLFANDIQTSAIINSLLIGVAVTVLCTIVSLPLALFNARYDFPGKGILSGLLLVPMVMPPFVEPLVSGF